MEIKGRAPNTSRFKAAMEKNTSRFEAVMESFRIWARPISNFYCNLFSPLGNILSTIPLYSPPHHICKNPRDDFYCNFHFGPPFGFRRRESPVLIEVVGDCTQDPSNPNMFLCSTRNLKISLTLKSSSHQRSNSIKILIVIYPSNPI